MGAQLRVFRRRIKSVQATKKITKAMELIASSRIVKAQQRLEASTPYLLQLTQAVSAAASHATDIGNHLGAGIDDGSQNQVAATSINALSASHRGVHDHGAGLPVG